MQPAIWSGINRRKTKARLHWNRARCWDADPIGMLLAQVIIHRPANGFSWGHGKAEQLIFETVCGFDLISAVNQPVIQGKFIIDRITGTEAHVVEGQKVEPERSRIVHLIFGVVSFEPDGTRKFAEVDIQAAADGNDVSAVGLKNVPVNIWPGFIGRISLQRVRGLAKLQIQTASETSSSSNIGWVIKYHAGLI